MNRIIFFIAVRSSSSLKLHNTSLSTKNNKTIIAKYRIVLNVSENTTTFIYIIFSFGKSDSNNC